MSERQFTMSMYASKEDLYKAKAEYYEKLYEEVCGQMEFLMDTVPNLDDVLDLYEGEKE